MKIATDTNVLVRAVVGDDIAQSKLAKSVLRESELAALPVPALCEFVWVLSQGYGVSRQDIAETIRTLINADAGLAIITGAGDFADGVVAFEGQWLGANAV